MHTRKRPAQPLPTTRNSKYPRLVLKGYDGGAPSPSDAEGIRSRWSNIGKEFSALIADTIDAMMPSLSKSIELTPVIKSKPLVLEDLLASTYSTPRQYSSHNQSNVASSSSNQYGAFPSSDPRNITPRRTAVPRPSVRPELIPLPPSPPKRNFFRPISPPPPTLELDFEAFLASPGRTPPRRSSITSGSSTPIPVSEHGDTSSSMPSSSPDQVLKTNIMPGIRDLQLGSFFDSSALSSQASDVSTRLSDSQLEDLGSQTSRRSSQSSRRDPLLRNLRNREHIFSKVHKASVRRNHLQLRDEITHAIFDLRRRNGFTSGFSDFKGLLDYQRKLLDIDLENAPPPLRAVAGLGPKASPRSRRRIESEADADRQFLERALEIAKATLNSPKPQKPFAPTFDQLRLLQRARDDDIERRIRPPVPALPSKLPPDDEKFVNQLLQKRGVVSKYAKEQVNNQDLTRLLPGQWLNDEIINFYGAMLLGRSESSKENPGGQKDRKKTPLNIHYFSSFFWTKLTQEGYEKGRLAKWTKRIDIFSKDIVLLPVNHGNAHWTAAAINFRAKRFESYDSMGMAKGHVCKQLRNYVNLEHQNKKKKDFDFTGWEDWHPDSTPQQENGFDCGVYTCQFMESLSRGEESFNFSQKDMPYLRRRMIWEIGSTKLRDGH